MEIKLKKIECALILGGLKLKLKKTKNRHESFLRRESEGLITNLNYHQRRAAKKNKEYKIKVLSELILAFEEAIKEDDVRVMLSEIDFDYPTACTEFA